MARRNSFIFAMDASYHCTVLKSVKNMIGRGIRRYAEIDREQSSKFLWRKHHKQQESIKCGKKLDEKNASPTTPTRVMSARRVMLSWAAMPFAIFILSGIIHASALYDFFRALTRWDKHMMKSLSEKWEVQLTESEKAREIAARGLLTGMIFHRRFRKRKEPFVCHPFDALSNLKWNVDWDAYLDEDEIEYVLNNAGTFAHAFYDPSSPLQGHTIVTLLNGQDALLAWDDVPMYIELSKEDSYAELDLQSFLEYLPSLKLLDESTVFDSPVDMEDFIDAMESWDDHMIETIREKWDIQLEQSGGYFSCEKDGRQTSCHPSFALSYPSWKANWGESLDEDEVDFVHANSHLIQRKILAEIYNLQEL